LFLLALLIEVSYSFAKVVFYLAAVPDHGLNQGLCQNRGRGSQLHGLSTQVLPWIQPQPYQLDAPRRHRRLVRRQVVSAADWGARKGVEQAVDLQICRQIAGGHLDNSGAFGVSGASQELLDAARAAITMAVSR